MDARPVRKAWHEGRVDGHSLNSYCESSPKFWCKVLSFAQLEVVLVELFLRIKAGDSRRHSKQIRYHVTLAHPSHACLKKISMLKLHDQPSGFAHYYWDNVSFIFPPVS